MGRESRKNELWQKARECLGPKTLKNEPRFRQWATIGLGEHDGGRTIAVRIRTVKPCRELEEEVTTRLREEIGDGVALDVQFTGPVVALPLREKPPRVQRKLSMGSPVSLVNMRSGTLGFFARCRKTDQIGIVSANHVIAGQDRARPNDPIISPGGLDYGLRVASFVRSVPLGGGGEKVVDCAFARLELDPADCDMWTLEGDAKRFKPQPATVRCRQRVWKYSQQSGLKRGIVTYADQDTFKMHYRSGIGLVLFDNQIEIESEDAQPFSEPGDSGSLVFTDDGRPVGLLFAQTLAGGTHGSGLAYANPINEVLGLLEVDLLTERSV